MENAFFVCRVERVGHLPADIERFLERERPAFQSGAERFAPDELHDEQGRAAGLIEAVDRRNVGMVECRERLRLALEAREPVGIVREQSGKNLESDVTIELRVPGSIDFAHPAGADRPENFVDADPTAHG